MCCLVCNVRSLITSFRIASPKGELAACLVSLPSLLALASLFMQSGRELSKAAGLCRAAGQIYWRFKLEHCACGMESPCIPYVCCISLRPLCREGCSICSLGGSSLVIFLFVVFVFRIGARCLCRTATWCLLACFAAPFFVLLST